AFAEPTTAQPHVLVFGDREFATRGLHIVSIGPRIGGEGVGVGQLPTTRFEQAPFVGGQTVQGHGQLDRLADAAGQVDKLEKLMMLAPVIDVALILDVVPRLPPIAYGGKLLAGRRSTLPDVEQYRLAGL